ncbi:MAG: flagellar biosynthesis anti-sigma factor FlgM [Panacagrimonas sp.]
MSTKIEAYLPPAVASLRPYGSGQGGSSVKSTPVPAAAAVDSVKLTGAAHSLLQFDQSAPARSVIDGDRVQAIRQALADGSYRIDSGVIASKLMRMEWELGGNG